MVGCIYIYHTRAIGQCTQHTFNFSPFSTTIHALRACIFYGAHAICPHMPLHSHNYAPTSKCAPSSRHQLYHMLLQATLISATTGAVRLSLAPALRRKIWPCTIYESGHRGVVWCAAEWAAGARHGTAAQDVAHVALPSAVGTEAKSSNVAGYRYVDVENQRHSVRMEAPRRHNIIFSETASITFYPLFFLLHFAPSLPLCNCYCRAAPRYCTALRKYHHHTLPLRQLSLQGPLAALRHITLLCSALRCVSRFLIHTPSYNPFPSPPPPPQGPCIPIPIPILFSARLYYQLATTRSLASLQLAPTFQSKLPVLISSSSSYSLYSSPLFVLSGATFRAAYCHHLIAKTVREYLTHHRRNCDCDCESQTDSHRSAFPFPLPLPSTTALYCIPHITFTQTMSSIHPTIPHLCSTLKIHRGTAFIPHIVLNHFTNTLLPCTRTSVLETSNGYSLQLTSYPCSTRIVSYSSTSSPVV